MTKRAKGGRFRKTKGDQGERQVKLLLEQAGWIVMDGKMTESGVDLICYWDVGGHTPELGRLRLKDPNAFVVLHTEVKNEPWSKRGRAYLGAINAREEARGILYRVFTSETVGGWFVRQISWGAGQCRTVYKAPANRSTLTLGGLLMGSTGTPPTGGRE